MSIFDSWPTFADRGPFRAVMPKGSNGYVEVHDKDGLCLATCWSAGGGSATATLVAAALNELFPTPEKPTGEDLQDKIDSGVGMP